jgi:hypothetical protein
VGVIEGDGENVGVSEEKMREGLREGVLKRVARQHE